MRLNAVFRNDFLLELKFDLSNFQFYFCKKWVDYKEQITITELRRLIKMINKLIATVQ